MNVVVVGYYYQWSSSVGSRRIRGIVRGLLDAGHEVTVICADVVDGTAAGPVGAERLLVVPHADRVQTARTLLRRVRRGGGAPSPVPAGGAAARHGGLRSVARQLVSFPDTMWEWTYVARRAARREGLRPDIVLATAPPMAALHAAAGIARRARSPWVADMRDLWTGDPYRQIPGVARPLDRRLERRVMMSAAAITTVAESLAEELRAVSPGVEVVALRNGFAAEWLREGDAPPTSPPKIVFTGTFTANTGRDIGPLCDAVEAMREMADGAAVPIVEFVGAVAAPVAAAVHARGLDDHIRFVGVVDAATARRAQHESCALLNFSWEDPRDHHKLPAKIFEYAAARRPILHLGKVATLGTELISQHGLGFVVDPSDPRAVARLMLDLASGDTGWRPPLPNELRPLSQESMVAGVLGVLDRVSRDRL